MNKPLTIRPMTQDDVPHCARWMAETPLWQRYGVTVERAAARLAHGLADGATIYIAECDGERVGFIWIVARGAFDRSGYIPLIAVRPGERGRGIGRALMAFAEGELFALSDDVFLTVSDFNVEAQQFYRRLGYQPVGALPGYLAPGISELIYRKRG